MPLYAYKKNNQWLGVDPLLGHSYLAAQFYHVEEPWLATCQHLRSHERIIIVVWGANQEVTRTWEYTGRWRYLGCWQELSGLAVRRYFW